MKSAYGMILAAALLLPLPALADDAADTARLAEQVVALSVAPSIDGRIDRMIAEAAARQPADKQAQLSADLSAATRGAHDDLLKLFSAYYAQAFTPAELKELLAFYQSPLGLKLVKVEEQKPTAVNAAIQQQIMKLMMQINAPK